MNQNNRQLDRKSIRLYIILQSLTLVLCWGWFAGWWSVAFFIYNLGDIEWWVLVATACMGLYGLRPNLERAIDTAWLKDSKTNKALADRVSQLRPIKRRIDLLFSAFVLVALAILTVFWISGMFNTGSGVTQ